MIDDVPNSQLVALRGETVVVMAPRIHMTAEEALVHAAWLVCMASCATLTDSATIEERFAEILKAVQNT